MRKLGEEVASRLKAVDMKGRLLTLKLMKRHPEAPVEAPKFMGHGICEQFSKSAPLADPETGGGATNDGNIIGEVAWSLLDSYEFDPRELRGLGLQVTKLEDTDGPVTETGEKLETGQRRLIFQAASPSKTAKSSGGDSPVKQERKDVKELQPFERLTTETLDQATLDELPPDIREEIISQLKDPAQGGAGTSFEQRQRPDPIITLIDEDSVVEIPAPPNEVIETPKAQSDPVGAPISSTKSSSKGVGHITRQLRPKAKTIISPTKSALFSKPREAFQPSKEELDELGLDAEVFFLLPRELQREQLAHERDNARKDRMAPGPGTLDKKTGGFGFDPSRERFTRSPSVGPQFGRSNFNLEAEFPEVVPLILARADATDPQARSTGKGKGRVEPMLSLVNLGDIQAHLKRWVVSSHKGQLEPADADVEALRSWLLKCTRMEGIEKSTIVLKWWRELLRGCWGEKNAKSLKQEGEGVNLDAERLREAWWYAFWQTKAKMDVVVNGMIGGKLSLR
jgi:DNA repair protein REV1